MPEEQVKPTTSSVSVEQNATQQPDVKTESTIDYSKYDSTTKEIFEKGIDGVSELLKLKREANEEAKKHREERDQLLEKFKENQKVETEKMTADIENKAKAEQDALKAENEKIRSELLESQASITDFQTKEVMTSHGINHEFLEDAKHLIKIPNKEEKETDEDYTKRVDDHFATYEAKYPQWFGVKGQPFDSPRNMSRNKIDNTELQTKINEAMGNTAEVIRLQEIRRNSKS